MLRNTTTTSRPQKKTAAYYFWFSTNAERRYDTTQRERLAIVWAVLLLRFYLKGPRITIRTEHIYLKWSLNVTDSAGRLACWRLRLPELDYGIIRRAGWKRQAADALSRLQVPGENSTPLKNDLLLLETNAEKDDAGIPDISYSSSNIIPLNAQKGNSNNTVLALQEVVADETLAERCKAASLIIDHARTKFHIDWRRLRAQKSIADKSDQFVAPTLFELVSSTWHLIPILQSTQGNGACMTR